MVNLNRDEMEEMIWDSFEQNLLTSEDEVEAITSTAEQLELDPHIVYSLIKQNYKFEQRAANTLKKLFKEDTVERNSNQITAGLGNTLNANMNVGGMTPEQFKTQVDNMGNMIAQSDAADLTSDPVTSSSVEATTSAQPNPTIDSNSDLGKALNGQNSTLDLSRVPDDQKNLLIQAMLSSGNK